MPRLYSTRNYLSTGLHYGATGALALGSFVIGAPWAIAVGVVAGGGLTALGIKLQKDYLETKLIRHPETHKYSPRLGATMRELYKNSGLDQKDYPVYDFRADDTKIGEKQTHMVRKWRGTFNNMAHSHNAAAMHLEKPVIMISEPLLELLDDGEEKAVLAHEFAHAVARHQHVSLPRTLLGAIATASNSLTVIGAALTSGWKAIGSTVVAITGLTLLTGKHFPLFNAKDKDISLQQQERKKKIKTAFRAVTTVAATGLLTWFNPAYLKIYAMAHGLNIAGKVINGSFSRSMEYQADRGAVTLGANPLELITSLRKMTLILEQGKAAAHGGKVPEKGFLRTAWSSMIATHPTLDKRVARLSAIARQQGFAANDIYTAAKAPVTMPQGNTVPSEVVRLISHAL